MYQLIYFSEASPDVEPNEVADMLAKAVESNRSAGLTGFICFSQSYFLQVLEGDREKVNALYAKICTDPRHKSPVIIAADLVCAREFPNWHMGYMTNFAENRELVFKFCGGEQFDPTGLSAEAALELLKQTSQLLQRGQKAA